MPLDPAFYNFTANVDRIFLDAVPGAVAGALGAVRAPLRAAAGLYVVVNAIYFLMGDLSARTLGVAAIRAACIAAIMEAPNYTTYIQDAFLTRLPGEIASALNGRRIAPDAARQFDMLREGLLNIKATILMAASGWTAGFERLVAHLIEAGGTVGIAVMWFYWYAPRVLMGVAVILGPFLIPLWLFEGTRQFAAGFFAKLVSILAMQVVASVLVLVLMTTIDRAGAAVSTPGGGDVAMMIARLFGCALLMWAGAFLMRVVPPAFSFAPSLGAASSALIAAGTAAVLAPARMAGTAARAAFNR